MKPHRVTLALVIAVFLALAGTALFFITRPPVLILTDISFASLYGGRRMLMRQVYASLVLFRPVAPVPVAESVGADVIVYAVEDVAAKLFSRPLCVLFPGRYAEAAVLYRQNFPETPAVLVAGPETTRTGFEDLPVFTTDRPRDFYRAGLCAAILAGEKQGKIPVFLDRFAQSAEREAFIRGLREGGNQSSPFFLHTFSELFDFSDVSCAVLAGSGGEYLEQNLAFPVILFTWMDPELIPREVVLAFDDSAWGLAIPAAKMAAAKETKGLIPSDLLIFSARIADKDILRQIKSTVRGSR
jgi:hypothetical protein